MVSITNSQGEKPKMYETNTYKPIADPKTWGELKKVISDFPDDCPICWINQPPQIIHERKLDQDKYPNERLIGFQ